MRLPALFVSASLALAACNGGAVPDEYVARLGSETLSRQELDQALIGVAGQADSLDAARQVLEQWVTNQLLFAEALRRGIDRDPGVRKNVEEAERAVVVDALLEELYGEAADGPTPEEVLDYYNQNQERLRLVEPYVRLRYIMTDSLELAREVRRSLARLDSSDTAAWEDLVARASDVPDLSFSLASSLVPETRAFSEYPQVAATVEALQPGRTGAVVADRGVYHIVQVLERVPAGTVPRQTWIEGALRQQLRIESRKLLYARLVQRLRNEALAREQLDIR